MRTTLTRNYERKSGNCLQSKVCISQKPGKKQSVEKGNFQGGHVCGQPIKEKSTFLIFQTLEKKTKDTLRRTGKTNEKRKKV